MARYRGGSSRPRLRGERESFERSTGYTKYKTNLERLFLGRRARCPTISRARPARGDEAGDEERKKLFAIEDPKGRFYAAATEYLKANELPQRSAACLDRLLGAIPDEDTVEKALGRLEGAAQGRHAEGAARLGRTGWHRWSWTAAIRRSAKRAAELRKSAAVAAPTPKGAELRLRGS